MNQGMQFGSCNSMPWRLPFQRKKNSSPHKKGRCIIGAIMTLLRISSPVAWLKNCFLEDVISKSKYLTRSFNNKNKKSAHSSPPEKKSHFVPKIEKITFFDIISQNHCCWFFLLCRGVLVPPIDVIFKSCNFNYVWNIFFWAIR